MSAPEPYNPVEQLPWMSDALCAQTDPEAFFPRKGDSTAAARAICASCEVNAKCLEFAQANAMKYGIYAGLSPRDRKKLRRKKAG